jgi:16S rRNA (cytidine1402-2'-O)-methyltransferase
VWRGTLDGAAAWAAERQPPGEIVIVLAGAPAAAPPRADDVRAARRGGLDAGATARDAAKAVAARLDVPRRRAYDLAVRER